jgi:hypothetical protein
MPQLNLPPDLLYRAKRDGFSDRSPALYLA